MEKLLEILETNPRLSNREIAVMLGKTEEEVEAQIRLYEETGIIKGYRAMIDKNKAKMQTVTALIELRFSQNSAMVLMKLQTELPSSKRLKAFIL